MNPWQDGMHLVRHISPPALQPTRYVFARLAIIASTLPELCYACAKPPPPRPRAPGCVLHVPQDKKRSIVEAALSEGGDAAAAAKKLTMEDLCFLFGR